MGAPLLRYALFSCIVRARRAKSFYGAPPHTPPPFEKGGRKLHFLTIAISAGESFTFFAPPSLAKRLRVLPAVKRPWGRPRPLMGFQGHKSLIYYSGLERGHETLCSRSAITREAPAGASPPMTISVSKKMRASATVLLRKHILWAHRFCGTPFFHVLFARDARRVSMGRRPIPRNFLKKIE